MYEIDRKYVGEWRFNYIYKSKNSKGQIIICETWLTEENYINFSFYITTKRKKGFQNNISTGRDGIRSLIWAKNCLIDFLNIFNERRWGIDVNKLVVSATDKQRFNVYKRALIPLGFKVGKSKEKYLYYERIAKV